MKIDLISFLGGVIFGLLGLATASEIISNLNLGDVVFIIFILFVIQIIVVLKNRYN